MRRAPSIVAVSVLLAGAASAQSEAPRTEAVRVQSAGDEAERVGTAALGLGPALPRRGPVQRGSPTTLESPGGVRLELRPDGLLVGVPGAPVLALDAEGRFRAGAQLLTRPAPHGLCVRFADGSELRYVPGRGALVQSIELVDAGAAHVLLARGQLATGVRRAAPFAGPRYYLVDEGRSLVQLSLFGPWLLVRPVLVHSGAERATRLLFCADLWRQASFALAAEMPARSAQYPLSRGQMTAVAEATARLFPRGQQVATDYVARQGEPLVVPLGGELRVQLERIPGGLDFVTRLRLHPDAPETIEVLHAWRNETMHRVLPPARQSRGRVVGQGLDLDAFLFGRLPWPRPLDGAVQRREALAWIQALLPPVPEGRRD